MGALRGSFQENYRKLRGEILTFSKDTVLRKYLHFTMLD